MKIQKLKIKNQKYYRKCGIPLRRDNSKLKTILPFIHFAFLIIILHLALYTLHLNARIVAAQSLSLSIDPPVLEVMIKPGKSITQVYKITNLGETTVVTPKLLEYKENPIEDPAFQKENWIKFLDLDFDRSFLLSSGAEKQLILRINPPIGTPEKDYYRILFFSSTPLLSSELTQSTMAQNLGGALLINVTSTGLTPRGAQITRFETPKLMDSFDPLNINIEVKNTGNTYFRPIGQITLTGPIGKGNYVVVPNLFLTGQTKQIFSELSTQKNSPRTLSLSGFFLGKYQISVEFTLGEGAIKIAQTKSFYALPWKLLLVIFVGAVGFLKLLKSLKAHKKKKA